METVGDDIAWMRFSSDGKLYAINPEAGFFGVAPGTSSVSNPNALKSAEKNSLFTNVALTDSGDVWWEGLTPKPPAHLIDWRGKEWTPTSKEKAAQANSRFTAPAAHCPVIDPAWQDPRGVPISAIIFGGRRNSVVPLVYEALNWRHGVFLGAGLSSETTAATAGEQGKLRHDPFAMLPFCGYNMGDYFAHWLSMEHHKHLPKIFYVNWFRKNAHGEWLWPGFGENSRVLEWIFRRCTGDAKGIESPIGILPAPGELNTQGLNLPENALDELFKVDLSSWQKEAHELKSYFALFGQSLPPGITAELEALEKRLHA